MPVQSSAKLDQQLYEDSLNLLKRLIRTPSLSREEDRTADHIAGFLEDRAIRFERHANNVIALPDAFDSSKPTLLLNSHHDTVAPNRGYTRDPFSPHQEGNYLFGLGSNDAGGALVSLLYAFRYYLNRDQPVNLVWVASAEEEISGRNGITAVLDSYAHLNIKLGIVGEPTGMQAGVAEKGLMVVDVTTRGQSGHAARDTGVNAIYKSLEQIAKVKDYQFERISEFLGPVRMTVTQIESGKQHNVIPDECRWVIDARSTDAYDNLQVLDILKEIIDGEVIARSTRLNSSFLPQDHVLYQSAMQSNIPCFGSPTLSDQALMGFPTVKMGPGMSERSHTADEYILLSELEEGMLKYVEYLRKVFENLM